MKLRHVHVKVDRPIGYIDAWGNKYPINYGYISGIAGGDGEEQDAYIVDIDLPVDEYEGSVIAIIHRKNDVENKWVVSNTYFSEAEIQDKVSFMEQYFDSYIEMLDKFTK